MASTDILFWLGIPVTALWGFYGPTASSQFSRYTGDSERGQFSGAISSIMGVAGMCGPTLFTQLFALCIAPERGWNLPGAPFLFAMLLLIVAGLLAVRATAPDPVPTPAPEPAPAV